MSNTKVYCYILNGNPYHDYVKCCVPTLIDKHNIFFGPCKKTLRQSLFNKYLKNNIQRSPLKFRNKKQYIIAFNSSNSKKSLNKELKGTRKIVLSGRISVLMTFEDAFDYFNNNVMDPVFFNNRCSPIHVEPIRENGEFTGYRHRGNLHKKPLKPHEWHSDILSNFNQNFYKRGNEIKMNQYNRASVFDRDCCFVCDKISFAYGQDMGIDITPKILDCIKEGMKQSPNNRKYLDSIDEYAIFGKDKKDNAIGKRGSYLEITGICADELIENIKKEVEKKRDITDKQYQSYKHNYKDCCIKGC